MKPLRRPRWLPGVSQAAPGRLLGAAKRNPGTSEDSKGVQGPLGTPKNPPRTPQEPLKNPLWRPMSAPIRGHRAPRECLKQEWRSEGVFFQKSARRLDGKHILEDFVLLHRPEKCLSQPSASTDWCKMSFSRQGSWHTSRNPANRKNGAPPPPSRSRPRCARRSPSGGD